MKNIPENDALEQRIRKMAENIEPPTSLSAENLLRKLPPRQRISIARRYAPAMALAACLLIVLSGTAVMRSFTGTPLVQTESRQSAPESSVSSAGESSDVPANSAPESSDAEDNSLPSVFAEPEDSEPSEENSLAAASGNMAAKAPESESPADDPPAEDSEGEQPEISGAELPPDALNLSYPGLQPYESLENYQDVYEALSTLRQNSIMQNSTASAALFSAKSVLSSAVLKNVTEGDTVQVYGSALYALSNEHDSIAVYQTKGSETSFVRKISPEILFPEIEGMHLGYSYISKIIAEGDSLLVIASATYWSDTSAQQKLLTAVSCYNIKDPLTPVYENTLCQEGDLSAVYINDGILTMITKYKLPTNSSLEASQLESFLPAAYENGRILLPRRSQVQISQDAASTVYTTIGTIDLSDRKSFADLFCYLSDTTSVYADDQIICLVRSSGENGVLLSAFTAEYGKITLVQEASFSGALFGEVTADTSSRYLRLVTKNSSGSVTVRILDKKLQTVGSMDNFSAANAMSLQYVNDLLCFFDNQNNLVGLISCANAQSPSPVSLLNNSYTQPASMYGFDSMLLDMREEYVPETDTTGIRLTMYSTSLDGSFQKTHTLLIDGDIFSDALYEPGQIYLDGRKGLLGFGITRSIQTETGYTQSSSYLLYQYDSTGGFKLLCEIPTSAADGSLPEYQTGIRSNNLYYVITPSQIYTIDLSTNKVISQAAVQ